ncbi:MAG: hypothetical protein WBF53_15840 [Litorimonas sp.]
MTAVLTALWRMAIAFLLYPLAFAAMIWIWWTGRSVWLGLLVLVAVLILDRSWWLMIRPLFQRGRPGN